MFHFSRRSLWIIIYITIPLIIVLNSLGPDEPVSESSTIAEPLWSLDQVTLECESNVCVMVLDDAKSVRVSLISSMMPDARLDIPDGIRLTISQQGGYFVANAEVVAGLSQLKSLTTFLQQWMPYTSNVRIVATGSLSDAMKTQLMSIIPGLSGTGVPHQIAEVTGLGLLRSPSLGSQSQLPFLLWVEILKNRLAGYQVEVKWDHRRENSYVVFSTTLSSDVFYPVESEEFELVRTIYMQSAQSRDRSSQQIHRYAVTSALYGIPFGFFVNQPERLEQVSLQSINQMREFSLEQIQTKVVPQ